LRPPRADETGNRKLGRRPGERDGPRRLCCGHPRLDPDRHARKHIGVAVGVLWQEERWTYARGRLRATHAAPVEANTIFEIGSITKVFTAILLADMVEQGFVRLDDPVQDHLPDMVRVPIRGRPMTLCDLATQTSGLPRLPPGLFRRSLRRRHDPYARVSEQDLREAVREHAGGEGTRCAWSLRPHMHPGRNGFTGPVDQARTQAEQLANETAHAIGSMTSVEVAAPKGRRGCTIIDMKAA
jgi:Beta-lactamase